MSFDTLGIAPRLTEQLASQSITTPTPIQTKAIPHALAGRDVIGLAQTGTGKTAAFGLPLVQILGGIGRKPAPGTVAGLVLAPTRELATQISDTLRSYTRGAHLKVALVVGGASMGRQIETLKRGVDILVATPGRLLDLIDRRAVTLGQTKFLVLDEADQMLDLGFIHALRRIAPLLSPERQTMLFSATMPKQMEDLAQAFLTDPVRIEVARPGKAADKIEQSVYFVAQNDKLTLLARLLGRHRDTRTLVFARTKHGAERLMKQLVSAGFDAGSIHGNKSQGQRNRAIEGLRSGEIRVLVATDVAARGIDIDGIGHVYNFDLPNVPENYVHRIGRTARAGAEGQAVAFCAPEEVSEFKAIEKALKASIPVAGGTPWEGEHKRQARGAKPRKHRPQARRGGMKRAA